MHHPNAGHLTGENLFLNEGIFQGRRFDWISHRSGSEGCSEMKVILAGFFPANAGRA
jgi:hypothetical protein